MNWGNKLVVAALVASAGVWGQKGPMVDATAAVWMLKTWDAFFCNESHGSRHDVYHPGISTMRHGENARAYGKVGDAEGAEIMQFENLRLANGKRVSGRRLDGVVEIEEREVNE